MDSAGWPVDLPRPRMELEVGRRRHRRITGPAGVLLFVCLFMPAVKQCDAAVYPIETPYFWHPYIYALALALGTVTITTRGLRIITLMLRALAWTTIAGGVALMFLSTAFGFVELALGGVLLAIIGMRGHSERRIAITGIVIAVLCLLWFGLWAGTTGALIGVYLSLVASIFLLAGALLWLSEL